MPFYKKITDYCNSLFGIGSHFQFIQSSLRNAPFSWEASSWYWKVIVKYNRDGAEQNALWLSCFGKKVLCRKMLLWYLTKQDSLSTLPAATDHWSTVHKQGLGSLASEILWDKAIIIDGFYGSLFDTLYEHNFVWKKILDQWIRNYVCIYWLFYFYPKHMLQHVSEEKFLII